jgi:hypothetical protein
MASKDGDVHSTDITSGGTAASSKPAKRSRNRIARKPGDLDAAKLRVWRAILRAESLLESSSADTALRAVHAVSQAAMCYAKLHETADLEMQLKEINAVLQARGML